MSEQQDIDIGRLTEIIQQKIDRDHNNDFNPYVKEMYVNETSGYIVWSNGFCEQWGRVYGSDDGTSSVALLKTYADTNYSVVLGDLIGQRGGGNFDFTTVASIGVSEIQIAFQSNTGAGWYSLWNAKGYLPEGEY